MTPINTGLALFLSCIFPGLGLWRTEFGKLVLFLGYAPAVLMLIIAGVFTLGIGLLFAPVIWFAGLFHTWLMVRRHNRLAAKEAGIAEEFASLKEQVQNLSS